MNKRYIYTNIYIYIRGWKYETMLLVSLLPLIECTNNLINVYITDCIYTLRATFWLIHNFPNVISILNVCYEIQKKIFSFFFFRQWYTNAIKDPLCAAYCISIFDWFVILLYRITLILTICRKKKKRSIMQK